MKLYNFIFGAVALLRFRHHCELANAAGAHDEGCITRTAEEAIGTAHLLLKKGAAAGGVGICDLGDEPVGFGRDEAALDGDVTVEYLGAIKGTRLAIAARAFASDVKLYSTDEGKVTDLPEPGAWYVGDSASASTGDGDEVEVIPTKPEPAKVITRLAEAALAEAFLIVKKGTADTEVNVNGGTDEPFGIAQAIAEQDANVDVLPLLGAEGPVRMVAAKAIDIDEDVFTAASGRVTDTSGAGVFRLGKALTAAANAGDVIWVQPFFDFTAQSS